VEKEEKKWKKENSTWFGGSGVGREGRKMKDEA